VSIDVKVKQTSIPGEQGVGAVGRKWMATHYYYLYVEAPIQSQYNRANVPGLFSLSIDEEILMTTRSKHLEPRWPAMLALFAVGGLRLALPEPLSVGPSWLLISIVGALIVPTVLARRQGNDRLNQILGYLLTSIVTLDMVWSLGLLLQALPSHKETPKDLLVSAAALWITNILVFASWYWRLDAGGPRARELRGVHANGAFLFPQMTLDKQAKRTMGERCWSPGFIDYLFLAFNTSTAFSPTDTPVLSPWAKVMVMVQSFISFTTVALLAARAVNIL
jgi:hypothetical protein